MIQTTLYIKWLLSIINTNLRPFSLSYYYIDFNVIVSCHWQAKTKIDTAFYITTNNIVFLKFVENHGGDETVTDLYIIMVYILFTHCNIRNAVSKGPIYFSLWCLQIHCSDDVSMCIIMSWIRCMSVYRVWQVTSTTYTQQHHIECWDLNSEFKFDLCREDK